MADTKIVNNIGRIQAAQVNRKQLSQKHKEYTLARMRRDGQAVQDLTSCFNIAFHLIQCHLL